MTRAMMTVMMERTAPALPWPRGATTLLLPLLLQPGPRGQRGEVPTQRGQRGEAPTQRGQKGEAPLLAATTALRSMMHREGQILR